MREPPQPATTTSAATASFLIIDHTPGNAHRFRPCQCREHIFDSGRRSPQDRDSRAQARDADPGDSLHSLSPRK
jgi:hypothetical protein